MLDLDYVVTIHDELLAELGGLSGFAASGLGGVEAALTRIANHAYYNNDRIKMKLKGLSPVQYRTQPNLA